MFAILFLKTHVTNDNSLGLDMDNYLLKEVNYMKAQHSNLPKSSERGEPFKLSFASRSTFVCFNSLPFFYNSIVTTMVNGGGYNPGSPHKGNQAIRLSYKALGPPFSMDNKTHRGKDHFPLLSVPFFSALPFPSSHIPSLLSLWIQQ